MRKRKLNKHYKYAAPLGFIEVSVAEGEAAPDGWYDTKLKAITYYQGYAGGKQTKLLKELEYWTEERLKALSIFNELLAKILPDGKED